MSPSLDGIRAKLARADQHIKQINDDIIVNRKVRIPANSVRAQSQFEMGRLDDPSTHRRRMIFSLKGNPPLLDLSFTLLAGEAVHQLRSVLDHLVYQLIVAKTKQPPTFNSAFPIVGKSRIKRKAWISAADEYAAQTTQLKQHVSVSAETLIQGLQPFQRGATYDQDPLWVLSELDNAYKHRLLLVVVHSVPNYWVTVTSRGIILTGSFQPNVRFEHGAEIGRIEITDPTFSMADADVSVDGELLTQIAFDEVVGKRSVPVFDCLGSLTTHVRRIVDDFVPEFF